MKKLPWVRADEYRDLSRSKTDEPYGVFLVRGPCGMDLRVIVSSDLWEHVSVSLPNRTPNWKEMCFVKDLFWNDDEIAIQFHPKKSDYINFHENCLHLWKPIDQEIPTPPKWMIGPYEGWEADAERDLKVLETA